MSTNRIYSRLLRLERAAASQGQAVGSIADELKAARERRRDPNYRDEWEKRQDPAYGLNLQSRIGKHFFAARKKRLEAKGGGSS